ncbi:MAG: hypothetical protein Q7J48_09135 [Nocardioides sp.]|nr:hypothetical protein [Nocardioides sp.]
MAETPNTVVQIHLEQLGKHSRVGALIGAAIGAEGGPPLRFVAAPAEPEHDATEHAAVSERFPVLPTEDLDLQVELDEWTQLARQRLKELDVELLSMGWKRRADRGRFWWSLRYDKLG